MAEHEYKMLNSVYRLSPRAYIRARKAIASLVNPLYIIRNRKFIDTESSFSNRKTAEEYREEISKIRSVKGSNYPELWSIDQNAALVLYSLVRRLRPAVVIETGVANGLSTRLILSAMNRNRHGELHSIEISRDVGSLVSGMDASRWHLHVGKPRVTLLGVMGKFRQIDLFLHDSDHSYDNMLFEFKAAYDRLGGGGVIVSDDVNWHGAFVDFARSVNKRPHIIKGKGTCIGVLFNGSEAGKYTNRKGRRYL